MIYRLLWPRNTAAEHVSRVDAERIEFIRRAAIALLATGACEALAAHPRPRCPRCNYDTYFDFDSERARIWDRARELWDSKPEDC